MPPRPARRTGPDRTLYYTHERFTGLLAPLIVRGFGSGVLEGFRRNGLALKEISENALRTRPEASRP